VNVEAWLKGLGLEQYAEAFAQNDVGEKPADAGIKSVKCIGDCYAPGIIAAAIWSEYRYARELDAPAPGGMSFKRKFVRV
jgi:hypothetical protein